MTEFWQLSLLFFLFFLLLLVMEQLGIVMAERRRIRKELEAQDRRMLKAVWEKPGWFMRWDWALYSSSYDTVPRHPNPPYLPRTLYAERRGFAATKWGAKRAVRKAELAEYKTRDGIEVEIL